jgi:hypothetical protein
MQPMKNHVMELMGFPIFFLWVRVMEGFFSLSLVDYRLFTFHLDSGLSMQVFFFFLF